MTMDYIDIHCCRIIHCNRFSLSEAILICPISNSETKTFEIINSIWIKLYEWNDEYKNKKLFTTSPNPLPTLKNYDNDEYKIKNYLV